MSSRKPLVALLAALVALAFTLGCGKDNDDYVPGILDGGPPPKKDSGNKPPVKKDGGKKPPIKKDGGKPPPPPPPKKDGGTPPPPPPKKDQGLPPPPPKDFGPPAKAYKVAAVQYGSGYASSIAPGCASNAKPNACALKAMTTAAVKAGAKFVVLPEYGLGKDQKYYEPAPTVGSNPGTSSAWPGTLLIKQFSQTARQHAIYLVFNIATYAGTKPNYNYYNTNIAFDPKGKVVARHFKFNLFGNETKSLTAGNNVTVFDTPLGKMGLLICADIYGSAALRGKLANQLKARVVAISSYWTVSGAVNWYTKYTGSWGVYTIVSNTTHSPGMGGGIYNPAGQPMAQKIQQQPSIVYATIPTP